MIGGGLGPYAPGEWSDDTQMAVVIAQVAADRGCARGRPRRDRRGLVRLARRGRHRRRHADPAGPRCRRADGRPTRRGRLRRGRDGAARPHRTDRRQRVADAHAPVALHFLDDPGALTPRARWSPRLTHRDALAGDACVLWCHAIRLAVLDGALPDLVGLVGVLPPARREQWAAWLADAERRPPPAFAPNGFVVPALQAAWSAIRHPVGEGLRSSRRSSPRCTRATTPTRSRPSPGPSSARPTGRRPCPRSGSTPSTAGPACGPTTCATSPGGWRNAAPRTGPLIASPSGRRPLTPSAPAYARRLAGRGDTYDASSAPAPPPAPSRSR